jgi:hypothetical protein
MARHRKQKPLLDPPYDGWAEWHEHAFPPNGEPYPEAYSPEFPGCRFDAVEDRLGRIFVWHVGSGKPVCLCSDRDTAVQLAKDLVVEAVRAR